MTNIKLTDGLSTEKADEWRKMKIALYIRETRKSTTAERLARNKGGVNEGLNFSSNEVGKK